MRSLLRSIGLVWASLVVFSLSPANAQGEWCWDAVVAGTRVADRYNLYSAPLADPTVHVDVFPDGSVYEWYVNTPGVFTCSDWVAVDAAVCPGARCCSRFADDPGVLVFYTMTAERTNEPGSESIVPGLTIEPCP